jgi:tripeptidyl-peptidase-1
LCSQSGRGIPDIAAQALGFRIFFNGQNVGAGFKRLGGRQSLPPSPPYCPVRPSLSTQLTANVQIVAGIISLLNDYQISQGKPPLGFLNPWLYGNGLEGLKDITIGSNPGCNTRGFSAILDGTLCVPPVLCVFNFAVC